MIIDLTLPSEYLFLVVVLRMCCLLLRNAFFAIAHIDAGYHTTAFIETTSLMTLVGMRRYMADLLLVYIWPVLCLFRLYQVRYGIFDRVK